MLKKVAIAGLAVVVGVAILAWLSPTLFDWMVHQGKAIKDGAEDAIPLETRIDMLKDKLKDLKNNKQKYYDQAAKVSVEVDQLAADVAKQSDAVAEQWKKIDKFQADLGDTQRASFRYGDGDFTRAQVEKQLKQDFDSAKTADAALDAKKELLSAKKTALAAATEQLQNLENLNADMETQLEQMKAELQRVRMREQQSNSKLDDSEYSKLKADMDAVKGKIAEREKALDLQAKFDKGGPIDPLATPTTGGGDINKEINDYKAGRNGTPAPVPAPAGKVANGSNGTN